MATDKQSQSPDDKTKDLDLAAYDKVLAEAVTWIREKWGEDKQCPYCGKTDWAVGPPTRFLHRFMFSKPEALRLSPDMFTVSCRNCGNTAFISRSAADDSTISELSP